jgi:hypothetical protein
LLEAPPGVGGGGGGCSGDECGAGCDDYDDCAGSGGDDCGDQCLNPTRLGIGGTGHAPVYPLTGAGLSPINWDTPLGTAWDETLGLPAGSLTSMPGAGQIIRSIMGQLGIPDLTGMNCMPICEASAPNNGECDNACQLAHAFNNTGVYAMTSPCFVPGFYAASGGAAYSLVAGGAIAGGESAEAATSLLAPAWSKLPAVVWGTVVAKATGAWDWAAGKVTSAVNKACSVP